MRVSPSIRQALAMTALCVSAQALAEPAKIGMITTLSGGGASLGIDIRDGFELAVKERNGQLGGIDVEMMIVDDGRKVDNAKQNHYSPRRIRSRIYFSTLFIRQ